MPGLLPPLLPPQLLILLPLLLILLLLLLLLSFSSPRPHTIGRDTGVDGASDSPSDTVEEGVPS